MLILRAIKEGFIGGKESCFVDTKIMSYSEFQAIQGTYDSSFKYFKAARQ
jgi:CRISPR/Cas system CMR-associated protein Cmr1 (group 7 of RAMP superfamily)